MFRYPGQLTNLEQLSLSQNMLSGAIPAALGDLASLRQGGRLRHPPPAAAAGEQFPDGGCRPGPDRRQGRRTGDAGRQRQQRSGRRSAAISLESTQWPERGAVVPKRGQSHLHGPAGADGGCSAELQAAGHRSERSIRFRYGDDHRGAGGQPPAAGRPDLLLPASCRGSELANHDHLYHASKFISTSPAGVG